MLYSPGIGTNISKVSLGLVIFDIIFPFIAALSFFVIWILYLVLASSSGSPPFITTLLMHWLAGQFLVTSSIMTGLR